MRHSPRSPNKYKLQKDFKDVCEILEYDPATELVLRRNELVEEADRYEALVAELDADNPDLQEVINYNLDLADGLRNHAERIDTKMLPFLYARKASHSVDAGDGTSLLEAFAKAATMNLRRKPATDEDHPTTQH